MRRNRVKLVIMAARTAHRHPQHCFSQRINLLNNDVHFHLDRVILSEHFRAQRKESGGDDSAQLNV